MKGFSGMLVPGPHSLYSPMEGTSLPAKKFTGPENREKTLKVMS